MSLKSQKKVPTEGEDKPQDSKPPSKELMRKAKNIRQAFPQASEVTDNQLIDLIREKGAQATADLVRTGNVKGDVWQEVPLKQKKERKEPKVVEPVVQPGFAGLNLGGKPMGGGSRGGRGGRGRGGRSGGRGGYKRDELPAEKKEVPVGPGGVVVMKGGIGEATAFSTGSRWVDMVAKKAPEPEPEAAPTAGWGNEWTGAADWTGPATEAEPVEEAPPQPQVTSGGRGRRAGRNKAERAPEPPAPQPESPQRSAPSSPVVQPAAPAAPPAPVPAPVEPTPAPAAPSSSPRPVETTPPAGFPAHAARKYSPPNSLPPALHAMKSAADMLPPGLAGLAAFATDEPIRVPDQVTSLADETQYTFSGDVEETLGVDPAKDITRTTAQQIQRATPPAAATRAWEGFTAPVPDRTETQAPAAVVQPTTATRTHELPATTSTLPTTTGSTGTPLVSPPTSQVPGLGMPAGMFSPPAHATPPAPTSNPSTTYPLMHQGQQSSHLAPASPGGYPQPTMQPQQQQQQPPQPTPGLEAHTPAPHQASMYQPLAGLGSTQPQQGFDPSGFQQPQQYQQPGTSQPTDGRAAFDTYGYRAFGTTQAQPAQTQQYVPQPPGTGLGAAGQEVKAMAPATQQQYRAQQAAGQPQGQQQQQQQQQGQQGYMYPYSHYPGGYYMQNAGDYFQSPYHLTADQSKDMYGYQNFQQGYQGYPWGVGYGQVDTTQQQQQQQGGGAKYMQGNPAGAGKAGAQGQTKSYNAARRGGGGAGPAAGGMGAASAVPQGYQQQQHQFYANQPYMGAQQQFYQGSPSAGAQ